MSHYREKGLLFKKSKHIFILFIAFSTFVLNFEYFFLNEGHSLRISKLIDSKRRGYLNAQKVLFLKMLPQLTC